MIKKRGLLTLLIISLFILGCQKQETGQQDVQEDLGTGILVIDSAPAEADVFVNDANSGKTLLELSNFKVGNYKIIIKKEGYEDFETTAAVEAGKRSVVEAYLILRQKPEEKPTKNEEAMPAEKVKQEVQELGTQIGNKIIPGKNLIFYYYFNQKQFSDVRIPDSDIFSKRFPAYFLFTRYSPAIIKAIDKNINSVKKEDCIVINGELEYLYSGKSLCIVTRDNKIAALGGYWNSTENAEIEWKLFD